jgi:putative ABC transport system permease protein
MKEVGIRKVVGAKRGQLVQQFLVESVLITMMAAVLGIYLFMLLYKSLYAILNLQVVLVPGNLVAMIGIVLGLVVAVGILAGSYPALFLSGLPPVDSIKSGTLGIKGKSPLRRTLVVVQYAVAIILILGTVVIYQQIDFMKNSELGFQKEGVILVQLPYGNQEVQQKYPLLRDQIESHPQVIGVSGVYTVPGIDSRFNMSVRRPGGEKDDLISMQILPGDFGYVQTMGLELKAGRDFSKEFSLDDKESILLNETAVHALQWENPIGSKIVMAGNREMTVIGVVKDFHVKSLHNKINPMIITIDPKMYGTMAIRINPDAGRDILAFVEKTWQEIMPFAEFNSRWMDDAYDRFYRTEDNTGRLITIFTCLALFVSALGLFGLASFMTSKRIKEIGVRKVLGASSGGILLLLSKQFSLWVLLSNIVAWPVAYFLVRRWLDNFAYRIELSPWPFILSGAAAWLVAVVTVSFKTGRAALSDPVQSLRYE